MNEQPGDDPRRPPREPPYRPPAQKRLGALRIGRVAGVPVYVNVSWVFVALLIAYVFTPVVEHEVPGLGAFAYVAALLFAVLLYASVFVHELCHVLMALAFHLPVRAVTLQFLGGISEIEREPDSAWREFAVAVVGPLASLAIGGLAYGAYNLLGGPPLLVLLLAELAWANLLVGVFNLLPGLPLDGGRILRAAIWAVAGRPHLGTTVAAWVGRGVAGVVLAAPWVLFAATGSPSLVHILWSVLIAGFLWAGSTQALMASRVRSRLPALRARDLARRAIPVTADLPLAEAIRRAQEAQAGGVVVVDHGGRPVAVVNEAAVLATPEQRRPWMTVGDVARRVEPGLILSAELSGEDLVRAMGTQPASEYLLVEPSGEVYGVLSSLDVDGSFARA